MKTVGYIGFSDAWGDLVYDALQKSAEPAGIKIVSNERYARGDSSVTGQVLKIVALRPDAVITGTSGTPGALPYLALAERGYKGQIYGMHALINPDFVRVGGPSVEGLLATDLRRDPEALVSHGVRANIRTSVNHLRHGSQLLEQLIQDEGLHVVGAEYSLETGVVEFFDEVIATS